MMEKATISEEEHRRLCFLLGTLLYDRVGKDRPQIEIRYGAGSQEGSETDLAVYEEERPLLLIDVMPEGEVFHYLLDRPHAFLQRGAGEYWVIDLQGAQVCRFGRPEEYCRLPLSEEIRSARMPQFSCCLAQLMEEEAGGLRELSVFSLCRARLYREQRAALAERARFYGNRRQGTYTAEAFYAWLKVRKNSGLIAETAELLFGDIYEYPAPDYDLQTLRGNLYFALRTYMKNGGTRRKICFAPTAAELKKEGFPDSVTVPDLFLVPEEAAVADGIYRGAPEWVIEIATPYNCAQDYVDKAQIYELCGVREYWIVNSWKRQVLVMLFSEEEAEPQISVNSFDEELHPQCMRGFGIFMSDCEASY